jgi:hypothetical protein
MSDSNQSAAATTAAEPKSEPQPQNPLKTPRQCRYIRTGGDQCRGRALTGNHYCHSHKQNRQPTFAGVKGYDRVAFLEDHASIELVTSQIMQGLLDRTVEPDRARAAASLLTVSNTTVRDRLAHERWLLRNKLPLPEQVEETIRLDCDELAPEKEYRGPTGTFEPQWSVSKYIYEQQCEQAGKPSPTCAADFPASGWLTEDEIKETPADFAARYEARIAELKRQRKEEDQAEAAAAAHAQHRQQNDGDQNGAAQNNHEPQAEASEPQPESQQTTSEPQPETSPETTLDLNAVAEPERLSVPCTLSPAPCKGVPAPGHYQSICSKQITCRTYPPMGTSPRPPKASDSHQERAAKTPTSPTRPAAKRKGSSPRPLPILSFDEQATRYFARSESHRATPSTLP